MNTPVNNSLNKVLAALDEARTQAANSHDWHTWNHLNQIKDQVTEVVKQTTESQIASVDDFIRSARANV